MRGLTGYDDGMRIVPLNRNGVRFASIVYP
jgi:hypothetical protein